MLRYQNNVVKYIGKVEDTAKLASLQLESLYKVCEIGKIFLRTGIDKFEINKESEEYKNLTQNLTLLEKTEKDILEIYEDSKKLFESIARFNGRYFVMPRIGFRDYKGVVGGNLEGDFSGAFKSLIAKEYNCALKYVDLIKGKWKDSNCPLYINSVGKCGSNSLEATKRAIAIFKEIEDKRKNNSPKNSI